MMQHYVSRIVCVFVWSTYCEFECVGEIYISNSSPPPHISLFSIVIYGGEGLNYLTTITYGL